MFRGLLVDAAGTLLNLAEPVATTYTRIAREHGVAVRERDVDIGFSVAFSAPWSGLRYAGDGRRFWRQVVLAATGSDDGDLFEALYAHYAGAGAWTVAPGARGVLDRVRAAGVRTAVVSDFDDRLRPLLSALDRDDRLDAVAVSCEVGAEKPDPALFLAACAAIGLAPADCVHIGDDVGRDIVGARAAGCAAWRWGHDVATFREVETRILPGT